MQILRKENVGKNEPPELAQSMFAQVVVRLRGQCLLRRVLLLICLGLNGVAGPRLLYFCRLCRGFEQPCVLFPRLGFLRDIGPPFAFLDVGYFGWNLPRTRCWSSSFDLECVQRCSLFEPQLADFVVVKLVSNMPIFSFERIERVCVLK